jgi:hypothetical protein
MNISEDMAATAVAEPSTQVERKARIAINNSCPTMQSRIKPQLGTQHAVDVAQGLGELGHAQDHSARPLDARERFKRPERGAVTAS